jgi:hypothetical protein
MAIKATASGRAPRGTKVLAQAFFAAAEDIPEHSRAAVIKAALAAIREQMKGDREKAKAVKEKAKVAAGSPRRAKVVAARKQPSAPMKVKTTRGKRKAVLPSTSPDAMPEMDPT